MINKLYTAMKQKTMKLCGLQGVIPAKAGIQKAASSSRANEVSVAIQKEWITASPNGSLAHDVCLLDSRLRGNDIEFDSPSNARRATTTSISQVKRVYIIAGEPSGDFIGHCIMKNLRVLKPDIRFVGIGGCLMEKQGLRSLFPISEISLMGFLEILPHIFKLKKLIKQSINDVTQQNPDLLITIDSPGFTCRVAAKVRELQPNLKIIHIVAPSVWAYNPGRAKKYAKIYDHLLALLPFEPPYFERVGLSCSYIGHPIMEQDFYKDKLALRNEFKISNYSKIICVTSGSRKGEIIKHMPIFSKALNIIAEKYKNLEVIFVLANHHHQDLIKNFLKEAKYNFRFSTERLKSFAVADAAIAKSGTNTLEIAASHTPMIVAYKLNKLTFYLLKLLIKFASLINIIPNKEIVPEFIQSNCTPEKISAGIIDLLSSVTKTKKQIKESEEVLKVLGFESDKKPSMIAAEIITRKFLPK